ncbi:uncharacterized protein LOC120682353 isoform X3 [Panicum virgatum]|uniref:uncharacterized protein LOC120682353 isoform X3 n=1 Tax=Panicum virgatum TaxID=38727 RepID=UPI0019D5745C|nr:uncharacterized protein LOC120682353 isoform X3 [Panicum virgatum]
MPEVFACLDLAKKKISDSFASSPGILKKVMDIVHRRWADQTGQKLCEAALFLNPNKYFDIKENDHAYASRLQEMFNDVIEKMITDDDDLIAMMNLCGLKVVLDAFLYAARLMQMIGGLPTLAQLETSKNSHGVSLVFIVLHLAMIAIGLCLSV